jgi:hypothetical protein
MLGKSCTLCILSFTSHVQDILSETSSRLRGGEDMGISESLPRIIDSNDVKPNSESILITHKRVRFTDTLNHSKMGRTYNALEWLDRLLIKQFRNFSQSMVQETNTSFLVLPLLWLDLWISIFMILPWICIRPVVLHVYTLYCRGAKPVHLVEGTGVPGKTPTFPKLLTNLIT